MSLNLNLLLEAGDNEAKVYRFLAELQRYKRLIRSNMLYPAVREIIIFTEELERIVKDIEILKAQWPRRIVGLDLKNKQLRYKPTEEDGDFKNAHQFIKWALPKLKSIVEEGVAAYEFVSSHLKLEIVGMQPIYQQEGYWFVENPLENQMHLYRYHVGIFTQKKEQYRLLKINPISTYSYKDSLRPLSDIKLDLIKENPELPNPSTYVTETDLEFPFEETILPVAKRNLIAYLEV